MQRYRVKKGPACSEQRKRGLRGEEVDVQVDSFEGILFICTHGTVTTRIKCSRQPHGPISCAETACSAIVTHCWHNRRMALAASPRRKRVTRTIDRRHIVDIVIATIATQAIIKQYCLGVQRSNAIMWMRFRRQLCEVILYT